MDTRDTRLRSRTLQTLSTTLMAAGTALVLFSLGYLAYARSAEARLSSLNQSAASAGSAGPAATAPQASAGAMAVATATPIRPEPFVTRMAFPPPTRVQIPRLEVDSGTMELGTKYVDGQLVWETPKWAVGHHQGTANPGEIGNMVLSGHISSPLSHEGNVFSRLPEINPGDDIIVSSDLAVITYRVTDTKVVDPSHVEVMDPTAEPQATLITCVPDWVYTQRLIVTAKPVHWEYANTGESAGS